MMLLCRNGRKARRCALGRIASAGALLLVTFSAQVFAQEWVTLPSISTTATYDTNSQLSPDNETSNKTYRVNPSVVSRLELPTSALDVNASATFTRSDDQTIQNDADEYNLGSAYEKLFEDATGLIEGNVSFEEFANSDFDEEQALSAVDDVQANDDDTILKTTLLLQYDRDISDVYSLINSLDVTRTEFSDDARTDFMDTRADIGLDYVHSATTTYGVELGFQYFDPNGIDAVEVARLSGRIEREIGESQTISVQMGTAVTQDRTSLLLDASYRQQFETFDLVASVSNDVQADDDGELNEQANADVTVTHPVSEFTNIQSSLALTKSETAEVILVNGLLSHDYSNDLRGSLSASYRVSENSGGIVSTETTQTVLAPSLTWTVNENLNAVFRYDEIHEIDQNDDHAANRRGTITLNYNLPPLY